MAEPKKPGVKAGDEYSEHQNGFSIPKSTVKKLEELQTKLKTNNRSHVLRYAIETAFEHFDSPTASSKSSFMKEYAEQVHLRGVVPATDFGWERLDKPGLLMIKIDALSKFIQTHNHAINIIMRIFDKKTTLIMVDIVKSSEGVVEPELDHVLALRTLRQTFEQFTERASIERAIDFNTFMIAGAPVNPELPTFLLFSDNTLSVVPDAVHANANIALHYKKAEGEAPIYLRYKNLLQRHFSQATVLLTPMLLGQKPTMMANAQLHIDFNQATEKREPPITH